MRVLAGLSCPPRFRFARRSMAGRNIRILDVGCGNNSPSITKQWLPHSEYHGADIQEYNLDGRDAASMDRFYLLGRDGDGYDTIPDAHFDFVILNHVIEHVDDQSGIVAVLCRKLQPGGLIWIAFPSVRSLALPHAEGSLNFRDDETHVRVCDVKDVANWLLKNGVKVEYGGRSRDTVRFLLGLAILPFAYIRKALTGRMRARGLWYVFGFEDCVIGRKPH